MEHLSDVRRDMRAAEQRIRAAMESESPGERLTALQRAYEDHPGGARDAFAAALIANLAFSRH